MAPFSTAGIVSELFNTASVTLGLIYRLPADG
jgi:hypothetical protein